MRVDGQEPDRRRASRPSGRLTAKAISIKGATRRSGDCARKAAALTPGDLCRVAGGRLRSSGGGLTAAQKSAEGVVGPDVGEAREALQGRKAEQQIGRSGNED